MKIIPVKIPRHKASKACLVSDEDYEMLSKHKWYIQHGGYVFTVIRDGSTRHTKYIHRFIKVPGNGMIVDHINRNKLDNRRENLRVATPSQSMGNTDIRNNSHGLRGIYKYRPKDKNRWIAAIKCGGAIKKLGTFITKEDAHAAYVNAHRELFGEFSIYRTE